MAVVAAQAGAAHGAQTDGLTIEPARVEPPRPRTRGLVVLSIAAAALLVFEWVIRNDPGHYAVLHHLYQPLVAAGLALTLVGVGLFRLRWVPALTKTVGVIMVVVGITGVVLAAAGFVLAAAFDDQPGATIGYPGSDLAVVTDERGANTGAVVVVVSIRDEAGVLSRQNELLRTSVDDGPLAIHRTTDQVSVVGCRRTTTITFDPESLDVRTTTVEPRAPGLSSDGPTCPPA